MIEKYTLKMLCEKYKLDFKKIVNNNILEVGEYNDIDQTLNYLINKLSIIPRNIEKCSSILYKSVNNISKNAIFLKSTKIVFNNIESCLHVLSSEPNELIETYQYVKDHYSENVINRIPSILAIHKKTIIEVEKLNIPFVNKTENLSIAIGIEWKFTNLDEIQKIIHSKEFKEHPELFTSQTLAHAKLDDIQKIIQSDEFKEHHELFTSTTLAGVSIDI